MPTKLAATGSGRCDCNVASRSPRDVQAGEVEDARPLALAGDAIVGSGCGLALGEDFEATEANGHEVAGGDEADGHGWNS